MSTRIFVSSTVFDLIDVRAEIERHLREMGLDPLLSGSSDSLFTPFPDRNSIETCLAHVDSSDAVILILNQRYGPLLGEMGYENISATHLEYRQAKLSEKPVYFYIRDRLDGDYRTWRKNSRPSAIELPWVTSKNFGLFALIDEQANWTKDAKTSNWMDIFASSVDLKRLIDRDLRLRAGTAELERLIRDFKLPVIEVCVTPGLDHRVADGNFGIDFTLKNVGTMPAYQLEWELDGETKSPRPLPFLAPGQESQQLTLHGPKEVVLLPKTLFLRVSYRMPHGHVVADKYEITWREASSGCFLRLREFVVNETDERPFTIAPSTRCVETGRSDS